MCINSCLLFSCVPSCGISGQSLPSETKPIHDHVLYLAVVSSPIRCFPQSGSIPHHFNVSIKLRDPCIFCTDLHVSPGCPLMMLALVSTQTTTYLTLNGSVCSVCGLYCFISPLAFLSFGFISYYLDPCEYCAWFLRCSKTFL